MSSCRATNAKGGPRPRSAPSETSDWVLRDVARCALCGAKMSASYGGRHKRTYYYRCSKACQTRGNRATNGSFVPIGEVESTVDEAVLGRLADLREELARGPEPEGSTQVVDFAAKRKALEGRRTRVLIMFEEGVLDREELRARLGRLDAERTKLDAAEVEASTASILASLETRRCVLRELAVIRKAWRQMRPADRRKVVAALAREVRIAKGREPVWIWMTAEELATNLC